MVLPSKVMEVGDVIVGRYRQYWYLIVMDAKEEPRRLETYKKNTKSRTRNSQYGYAMKYKTQKNGKEGEKDQMIVITITRKSVMDNRLNKGNRNRQGANRQKKPGNNIANKMAKSRKRSDKTHQEPRAILAADGGSACVG